MDSDLYATPERDPDWDSKPLPNPKISIIKNHNYRHPGHPGEKEKGAQHGQGEELSMANAELAGLKLLLHDSIKAQSHQEHQRKKSQKSKKFLLFIILMLTNLLSIITTGSTTYYMCQDRARPSAESQSEMSGQNGPMQPGMGIIPTLHLGSELLETSGTGKKMTGGGEYEITGISGRSDNSQQRDRLTNTSKPSSLLLGSIWGN